MQNLFVNNSVVLSAIISVVVVRGIIPLAQ